MFPVASMISTNAGKRRVRCNFSVVVVFPELVTPATKTCDARPSSGTLKSTWYDEYDAHIGTPLYAAPTAPYPVSQGGDGNYWRRTYSNGLVLVNPSKTKTSYVHVPAGYKRLHGTQDPAVNNGQVVSTVTLPPRSGLLLIRN